MKRARRVISHHGSDCPDGPHNFRQHRCIILTRIDRPGHPSEAWVSGDCAETMPMRSKIEPAWPGDPRPPVEEWPRSERLYRHRHTFDATKPTFYGGGFWERVSIPSPLCRCADHAGDAEDCPVHHPMTEDRAQTR